MTEGDGNGRRGSAEPMRPPHPATVSRSGQELASSGTAQRRKAPARPPHPATLPRTSYTEVAQRAMPPASLRAPAARHAHPARAAKSTIQRMEGPPVEKPKKSLKEYAVSTVPFDRVSSAPKKKSTNALLARVEVSLDDVRAAVEQGKTEVRLRGTNYTLTFGTEIKLTYLPGTDAGHIKGAGKDGVTLVETIKTYYEDCGLGKLLAAAFYLYWQRRETPKVALGTNDTSRGFWPHLGVGSNPIKISEALRKLNKITVVSDLSRAEPAPEQDYTKKFVL